MQKNKLIFVLLLLATVGVVSYFLFFKNKNNNFSFRTSKVEKGDITINVTATGSVNAVTTVQVGTQVSGTISKILVDFNSMVKEGQIVALLDTTFLAASYEDAKANVDKAQSQLDQSKREYTRMKQLFDGKVSSQADYDLALTNYQTSQSMMRSMLALLNRAKINLQYATIKAPISGTVISRNVDVGQTVISSFNSPTLFTIANDLTKMQVQANIDEADIGQVKMGQSVSFTVDAYPNEIFKGEVKQIRLQPTIVQNVVNYIVIIDVPNPNLKLMPGLTANINVKIKEHKNVLKIPLNAMHFNPPVEYFKTTEASDSTKKIWEAYIKNNSKENKTAIISDTSSTSVVWIQRNNFIYPVKIISGISDGTFSEVIGDIHSNDEVVTGVNQNSTESSSAPATKNPFMPSFQPRKRN